LWCRPALRPPLHCPATATPAVGAAPRRPAPPRRPRPHAAHAPTLAPRPEQKESPSGDATFSAHPARFSPDDKFSKQRVALKKRFGILMPPAGEPARQEPAHHA